ncbi:MAG: YdeI/OmpD-associated family protein [Verrucomicrobiota bacterium]
MKSQRSLVKKSVAPKTEQPILHFETEKEWDAWLSKQPSSSSGIWLRLHKKGSPSLHDESLNYAQALEVALCYGWIDSQKKSEEAHTWLQKFTPRGPRSLWSKVNRQKVLLLQKQGRMKPAGLAEIERAKKNGLWQAAYDSPSTAKPCLEFQKALQKSPLAATFFKTLPSSHRYSFLFRLQTVKKAETKSKKIKEFVEMLEKGETIHLFHQK